MVRHLSRSVKTAGRFLYPGEVLLLIHAYFLADNNERATLS